MNTNVLTNSWKIFKITIVSFSALAIVLNMFLVYSASQNAAIAQQMEQETYEMRAELLAKSGGDLKQIHSNHDAIQVSHLVIVEPITVSVSE